MQSSANIPFIPKVPSLPKAPPLMTNFSGIALKKLKSLNLKEFTLNLNRPEKEENNSIFNFNEEIDLGNKIVEYFFKVKEENNTSKELEKSAYVSETKKEFTISSLIDKNKFTAIYVSIRKLNSKVKFNNMVENFHKFFQESEEEEDQSCEEIVSMLQNQEIVTTLYGILPTDNEIKLMFSQIKNIKIEETTGDTEKWFITCCECEGIKTLIETLMSFYNVQSNIIEISSSLDYYLDTYKNILKNKNLQLFLNIILRINNLINKEVGIKELSHFDIRSIETLCNLKVNGKNFMQFAFDIYCENLKKRLNSPLIQKDVKVFDHKETSLFISLLEPYNSLKVLSLEIEKIKEEVLENISKLQTTVKNKFCLNKFSDIMNDIDEQLQSLIKKLEKEKKERTNILDYFNFPEGNQFEFIAWIFKSLLNLGNKLQVFYKEFPLTLNKENPELKLKYSSTHARKQSLTSLNESANKNLNNSSNLENKIFKVSHSRNSSSQSKQTILPSSLLNLKYKLK